MKRVLIVYDSRTGRTGKMAECIADGIRSAGHEVCVRRVAECTDAGDLAGYDAYLFGAPTYFKDTTAPMKELLMQVSRSNLEGKLGGAFGSYTHIGNGPRMIYDALEHVFGMNVGGLNPLNVKEQILDAGKGEDACREFGRAVAEQA